MTARTLRWAASAVVVLGLFTSGPRAASGQDRGRQPPVPRRELEERVRERFEAMVNRELGLTAEESRELRRIVVAFQQERRALGRRQVQLRRRLAPGDVRLAEDAARAVLDELVEVQREEARIMEREIDRLLTVLSPAQVVRFYTLRERMADRIRALQQGGRPPGGRRTGGGGGPPRR